MIKYSQATGLVWDQSCHFVSRGSIPLGGCKEVFSPELAHSLDIHFGFAIFTWTTLVLRIEWDTNRETPSARAAFFVLDHLIIEGVIRGEMGLRRVMALEVFWGRFGRWGGG